MIANFNVKNLNCATFDQGKFRQEIRLDPKLKKKPIPMVFVVKAIKIGSSILIGNFQKTLCVWV